MAARPPVTVAFVCTRNDCRSQIAEALARELATGVMEPHSAGTHPAEGVNADALRLLAERGTDVTGLTPKELSALPPVDVVVTMGCGVECPALPAAWREDWGLKDPEDRGDDFMRLIIEEVARKVLDLRARILAGALDHNRLSANLKVLGDPTRMRVIRMLADGRERCARELLRELDVSQPTLSHHMAALRDAGLVSARREGRWSHYRLDADVLRALGACVTGLADET